MKRNLSLALLVCFAIPAYADGPGSSKSIFSPHSSTIFSPYSSSIFPSYSSSIFAAPSLKGSVAVLGPRWPSMAKRTTTSTSRTLENGVLAGGDFVTSAPFGEVLVALKDASLKDAAVYKTLSKEITKSGAKGLRARWQAPPAALAETRRKINAEISALDRQAERAAKQGGFLSKLGTALEILDFVSVAAQGAGYLYEGDATGAVGVVANEVAKKTAEGVGALATSFVPGGSVFGAWGGNKAWETYIKPVIDKREQDLREADLARAILNKPWLTPKSFMDSTGRVRDLGADQYIERGTGLIRRRPPQEQADFERTEHIKWRNHKIMEEVQQDYAEGKISDAQFSELQANYRSRSPAVPWQPPGYSTPWFEARDDEDDEGDKDTTATQSPSAADAEAVVAVVLPIALSATGSFSESFKDHADVITTFEFAFWNLGAFSPGYEQAVLRVTSSHDDSQSLIGHFSGGPNGTLTFTDEDGVTETFRLQGGTQLIANLKRLINDGTALEAITLTMPLSDPGAFKGWPANVR